MSRAVVAERERCARIVEVYDGDETTGVDDDGVEYPEFNFDMDDLAERIRLGE